MQGAKKGVPSVKEHFPRAPWGARNHVAFYRLSMSSTRTHSEDSFIYLQARIDAEFSATLVGGLTRPPGLEFLGGVHGRACDSKGECNGLQGRACDSKGGQGTSFSQQQPKGLPIGFCQSFGASWKGLTVE